MPQPNSSRRRILAFPYSPTLSHVSRPLMIAAELRKRGIEVVFAGGSHGSFVRDRGFPMVPVYEPDPAVLFGNIRKGNLRFVADDEIERMIEGDLRLYEEVRPDLVLSDGRFTAPLSTHMAGLKHAAIVNVSSTEYRANPYVPFFDRVPEFLVPRGTQVWQGMERFNLALEMAVFDRAMGIFSRLSRKLGMKKRITATNCLTGKDLTLLPDVPEYFPTCNLPSDYAYIGPLTLQAGITPPAWWPPKRRGGALLYLTMGTTGIGELFPRIRDLVRETDLTVVATTGGQAEGLEREEGIFYPESYMDGDLIMGACDLVVCHGGNGTIYQALQHGKSVIGIPTIPDQKFNMRRVEALGVGKAIDGKAFMRDPRVLLHAVASVMESGECARNARRMQSLLDRYNGAKAGAELVERLLG
jgi:UDP:flavonoid glycosyltransferase YjiC (YdhE family)